MALATGCTTALPDDGTVRIETCRSFIKKPIKLFAICKKIYHNARSENVKFVTFPQYVNG